MTDLSKYNIRPPSAQKKTNIFLIGPYRTGKTRCAIETSPQPVLGHSFDPTGFDTVRNLHDGVNFILDTQFEADDPMRPTKFAQWDRVFRQMVRDKVFDNIGTYVLDSATTWTDAAMNAVLQKHGRAGQSPVSKDWKQNDWTDQKTMIFNALAAILALPCNVIVTAHPTTFTDSVSGRVLSAPMLTGNLKDKVPLLFSFIFYSRATQTSTGIKYSLLTQPDGLYNAGARIPSDVRLEKFEEPNISNILRKVGLIE